MKNLSIIIIFCFMGLLTQAQNRIVLKDGVILQPAEFHKIENSKLEFIQEGSLHDIEIDKIDWFEKDTKERYYINPDGTVFNNSERQVTRSESPEVPRNIHRDQEKKMVESEKVIYVDSERDKFKNFVTVSPLTLLEPEMAVQLGFQHKFTRHIGLQTDVSFIFTEQNYSFFLGSAAATASSASGLTVKSELKLLHDFSRSTAWKFYLAPQLMYKKVDYENMGGYTKPSKEVIGAHFKFGMERISNSGFLFDWYVGLGMRTAQSSYLGNILPSVALGVRLGFGI